jgi:hypothetical protein
MEKIMDIENFKKFMKSRGITDQKIEENIRNSTPILKVSQNGPVTVAHMDQIVRMGETKKADPKTIESFKRTCTLIIEFQRSLEKKNAPASSAPIAVPIDTEQYPYGFLSTLYFKIPFLFLMAIVIAGFALKYIPIDPSGFLGRNKIKLDDLVYPLPLVGGLSKAVKDSYEAAKHGVKINDLASAEFNLKKAVRLKPDFTEAWYNLGATQANLSIEFAKENKDKEAIAKFKEAVDSKKRAKELMDKDIWFIYKEEEQINVRSDVENALADADETIANKETLLMLLKTWH